MNNSRRKAIKQAVYELQNAITETSSLCHDILESLRDEEQEAYDNMPEALQYSERGEQMQDAINALEDFISRLEDDDFISSETEELFEGCQIEGDL